MNIEQHANLMDMLRVKVLTDAPNGHFSFLDDGETVTSELTLDSMEMRARAIGAHLQQHCQRGDRVLMLYPPGLEFIGAFFGCIFAGAVAVPAYPPRPSNQSVQRLIAIIRDAAPHAIITTSDLVERIRTFMMSCPGFENVPVFATDAIGASEAPAWRPPAINPDDVAFLQYTSGATGRPKGVIVSHRNILHNLASIRERFRLDDHPGGCAVFWLPPYHDMGLIGGILTPVFAGFRVYLFSPVRFIQKPVRWLQAISKFGAVCSGAPNFAFDLCAAKTRPEDISTLDLDCWKIAFSGAEPVRASTLDAFAQKFEARGFRRNAVLPCYGMAESTLLITGENGGQQPTVQSVDAAALEDHLFVAADPGTRRRDFVGCGEVPPEGGVIIVDPNSRLELAPGNIGEIWVSSPSVAAGYWNNRDGTEATFQATLSNTGQGPFLRTGDLGATLNGQLFVVGRSKDLIIVRGKKFHPEDIEAAVDGIAPALRPTYIAVFSVEQEGEEALVIVAEVDRHAEKDLAQEEIILQITKAVAEQFELRVGAVVLVKHASMPKTSSGKHQRHACKQAFLQEELKTVYKWTDSMTAPAARAAAPAVAPLAAAVPEHPAADRDVRHWLVEHVAEAIGIPASTVDTERPFSQMGLDSLQLMGLLGELVDWCGCELNLDSLDKHNNIDLLARYADSVRKIHEGLQVLTREERSNVLRRLADTGSAALEEGETVPEAWYRPTQFPEYLAFCTRKSNLESGVRNPFFSIHDSSSTNETKVDGRAMMNFSSNNYLAMASDPVVLNAVKMAVEKYGTSASASRLLSGEKPIHGELERSLAKWIGVEDCVTFVGGNLANVSAIGHLLGPGDLVLYDELSHDSVLRGARLAGTEALPFPHNDWQALDAALTVRRRRYRRVLVFIEGIYSMDGDSPDLRRFIEVKTRHKVLLMVDECLSIGVLGAHGRGIGEASGVAPHEVDIWMGGISKALASCGGYIGGSAAMVSYLRYTAPGFVYTTAMSPANAAAALAALKLLERESWRVERLHYLADLFRTEALSLGLDIGKSSGTPVIPIIIPEAAQCMQVFYGLFGRGINVQPILYPAVPANASRLRFFVTSAHTEDEIRFAVRAVAEELQKTRPAEVTAI